MKVKNNEVNSELSSRLSDATPIVSEPECRDCSRRQFLTIAAGATLGAVILSHMNGVIHFADADEAAGQTEDADGTIHVSLEEYPELKKIGGSLIIDVVDNDKQTQSVIVVRAGENTLLARSAICTHKGCKVEYEGDDKEFVCHCHGSRFGLNGEVLRGPAKRPLKSYKADIKPAA